MKRWKWKDTTDLDGKLDVQSYETMGKLQLATVRMQLKKKMELCHAKQGIVPGSCSDRTRNASNQGIIKDVSIDDTGQLFAFASSDGTLDVWDFDCFRTHSLDGTLDDVRGLLQIHSKHDAECIKWNPLNQNEIVCVGSMSKVVSLYDLQICQDTPTDTLFTQMKVTGTNSRGTAISRDRFIGLNQVHLSRKAPLVYAGGTDGNVYMWDRRASRGPAGILSSTKDTCSVLSITTAHESPMLVGGTLAGNVHIWDLRTGKAPLAFTSQRTPLAGFRQAPGYPFALADGFRTLPQLSMQTTVQNSGVSCLTLDPQDGKRLGFVLNCGWSGVLDLCSLELTHVHCPPWKDKIGPCKGEWAHLSTAFLVAGLDGIRFLDFSSSPWAGCGVDSSSPNHLVSPGPATLHVSDEAGIFALHPLSDELVIGTSSGTIALGSYACKEELSFD